MEAQPMFFLSLGSKELFHTNFFKWLSNLNLQACADLFASNVKATKVEREEKKNKFIADLVFYKDDVPVMIVENKVKDVASQTQLDGLRSGFGTKSNYVLLNLYSSFSSYPNWSLLSYERLLKKLDDTKADFAKGNGYYLQLIEDYIRFTSILSQLIKLLPRTVDYNFANRDNKYLQAMLEPIRVWELFQRICGRSVVNQVEAELRGLFPEEVLHTNTSINHKSATLDFYFKWKDFSIGVQIEDCQYRRFLHGINAQHIAKRLRSDNIWFNQDFKSKGKDPHFGGFDLKHKGWFKHQYCPDFYKNSIKTGEELTKLIGADLMYLVNNKKAIFKYLTQKHA